MLDILDDPDLSSPPKPESFRKQIAALAAGGTIAKAQRLALDSPEAADLPAFTRKFRLSIDAEVSKARKSLGREFQVEQGTFITGTGQMLVVVAVTRE